MDKENEAPLEQAMEEMHVHEANGDTTGTAGADWGANEDTTDTAGADWGANEDTTHTAGADWGSGGW